MTAVPTRMRGVYLPGDRTVEVRDLDVPAPGPGQVLLEMGASGICGTDIGYIYRGYKGHVGEEGAAYRGVVAGHEPAGRIVAVGKGVHRFGVDDRVLLYHIVGCGRCRNCRAGYFISCHEPERAAYGWQRDGGHAPYILGEESTCVALPDELSYIDGAFVACGVGTVWEGLSRIGASGRDELAVVGLGPVGLAAALLARGLGVQQVIGIEPNEDRRRFAASKDLFSTVLDATDDVGERIRELTGGRGVSTAIDASGSSAGRSAALGGLAEWSRLSLVGEGGRLETEVSDTLLHRNVTIHASWVTSLPATQDLVRHLVEWDLRPETLVSDTLPLARADKAYDLVDTGASAGKVCLIADAA